MLSVAKHLIKTCWPALLTGMLLLSACENDLKKVQELAGNQLNMNVDTIHGVDMIFSDSAKVKFRIQSPLLLQYNNNTPKAYKVMPKTVNVIIFQDGAQAGTIVADTGIQSDVNKNIQFKKNVVAKNDKGETFKSDELIWDQGTKMVHSDKPVQITLANGDIMNGTGFLSDDKMIHWTLKQSTAILNVSDAPTQ